MDVVSNSLGDDPTDSTRGPRGRRWCSRRDSVASLADRCTTTTDQRSASTQITLTPRLRVSAARPGRHGIPSRYAESAFTEIADRVYVARYPQWDVNVGLVVGTAGALVIDTRSSAAAGAEVLRDVAAVAGPERCARWSTPTCTSTTPSATSPSRAPPSTPTTTPLPRWTRMRGGSRQRLAPTPATPPTMATWLPTSPTCSPRRSANQTRRSPPAQWLTSATGWHCFGMPVAGTPTATRRSSCPTAGSPFWAISSSSPGHPASGRTRGPSSGRTPSRST